MAGGNVTTGNALKASVAEAIRKTTRSRNNVDNRPNSIYLLKVTKALTSTALFDEADDTLLMFQFPANCRLLDWGLNVTDLDVHATPTLKYEVILTDSDGVEDTSLALNAAVQAAAGYIPRSDYVATVGLPGLDVSEKYFGVNIEAAPATAASTFTAIAYALVYVGNVGASGSLTTIVS